MNKHFTKMNPLDLQNIQARICRDTMSLSNLELTGLFIKPPPVEDEISMLIDKICQFKFSQKDDFISFISLVFTEPYLSKIHTWGRAVASRKKAEMSGADVTKATLTDIADIKLALKQNEGDSMTVPEIIELAIKNLKSEIVTERQVAIKKLPYIKDKNLFKATSLYLWLVFEQRVPKDKAKKISMNKHGVTINKFEKLIAITES
ncbi:hypothetical protein [Moritella sp. F3]|uniref:hypothetical protein n=1 Tax=Moritella sp. F3 TaxID=2718882 RepID=UPI0018E1D4B9|nr:hypothetical protein [Moritella sp. F3]GIC77048.1 hypothetical protein FMO001_17750 [Moritella sp. F1]GIC82167.1 hypothetical protein FMO003_24480 [Moritella sp. F3]